VLKSIVVVVVDDPPVQQGPRMRCCAHLRACAARERLSVSVRKKGTGKMAASMRLGRRGVFMALRAITQHPLSTQSRVLAQSKPQRTAAWTGAAFRHLSRSPSVCGECQKDIIMGLFINMCVSLLYSSVQYSDGSDDSTAH